MSAGLGAWSLRQAAARFCALPRPRWRSRTTIGSACVRAGAAVRAVVLPKKGGGHVLRVLRDVVELPRAAAGDGLDALLATAAGRLRRRVVLFVLSDFAGERPLPLAAAVCAPPRR
jgi:hypothetical protein